MNREELKKRIESLPLFELRDIKVREDLDKNTDFVEVKNDKAICAVGETKPYAFVGPRYYLMQFKEVFSPILDSIQGEIKGHVIKHEGFAAMTLFPKVEALNEDDTKFGLIAMNSVDCSSAIVVKFCVDHKDYLRVTIPPKVAGLKKMHQGKIGNVVKDYMSMIGPVKDIWGKIVAEFPKCKIVLKESDDPDANEMELGYVFEQLKIKKLLAKKLKKKYEELTARGREYTLWDLFIDAASKIEEKDYKSEVHRQRNLDKLSQAVFEFAIVMSL